MATNFPASLDSLTNPTSSDSLNSPSHSAQHANVNDAVEALQAKVGVDSSAVSSSLDYKVAQLESDVAGFTSGKILQVVYGSTSTQVSSSSTTYADTGLSVSITPSSASSNVLVLVNQNGIWRTNNDRWTGTKLKLVRDSTDLNEFGLTGYTETVTGIASATLSIGYLDSPATTSAVTYKTQFANTVNAAAVYLQFNNVRVSTIVAMEVAS